MKSFIKSLTPEITGILVALVGIALAAAIFEKLAHSSFNTADVIQLVITGVLTATIAVALFTHRSNESFQRSATNLENSISLMNRAAAVLKRPDGTLTNDRVSWVTSARLISRALNLGSRLSSETHKLIYEGERDFQRHMFGQLFAPYRQSLRASFFVGGDTSMSIGQAVTSDTQREDGLDWIPQEIAAVIYRFFIFPEDYSDPLTDSPRFSDDELDRLYMLGHKGLVSYYKFRKSFFRVKRNIRSRAPNASKKAATAEEIDAVVHGRASIFD